MQKLKQIYRSSYAGESIVTELNLSNNEWDPVTEFVPNSVFNTHVTTQAIAIGNGPTRNEFDLTHIARHRGGILARDKLQSYGCNYLYQEFTPDFLVATDRDKVKTIAESGYCDDHIVYTNAQYVLEYPGKFYLTPQNPAFDAWLALMDTAKYTYWVMTDIQIDLKMYFGSKLYPLSWKPIPQLILFESAQLPDMNAPKNYNNV